jgi:hypothetical protein
MRRAALVILLVLLALPASAQAQEGDDRVVITGGAVVGPRDTAGDVVVVDGPVLVAGRVTGDLVVVSGAVRVLGTVEGDVVSIAEPARLGPEARVGGDIVYADERPQVPEGATVGGEIRRLSEDEIGFDFLGALALWLAVTISVLALGLLLLWLAPRALEAAWAAASTSLGATIGWGLLAVIGLPIVAVLILLTLVGIPLGVGLLLALLPFYALGYATAAWLVGRRILGEQRGRLVAFLAGLAILRALALIPIIGGLFSFAATVVGVGALVVALWRARRAPAYEIPKSGSGPEVPGRTVAP